MKVSGRQWQYLILGLLILSSIIPSVFARTGVSPLDSAISTLGSLFNIQAFNNSFVREGFMRLMVFVATFAVVNAALLKAGGIFNPKTAGIVSFAFSMIGTFLAPSTWFDATSGTIIAIMSSLLFIGLALGGAYFAMIVCTGTALKDMFGLLIILLLLMWASAWGVFTGLPILLLIRKDWVERFLKW